MLSLWEELQTGIAAKDLSLSFLRYLSSLSGILCLKNLSIGSTRWEAASVADDWLKSFRLCFSLAKKCKRMDRSLFLSNSIRMTMRSSLPILFKRFFREGKVHPRYLSRVSGEARSSKSFVTRLGTSPLQRKKSCSCCSSSRSLTIRTKTALRSN